MQILIYILVNRIEFVIRFVPFLFGRLAKWRKKKRFWQRLRRAAAADATKKKEQREDGKKSGNIGIYQCR